MREAGLEPGARAYHSLVFAHAKADQAEKALQAIRQAWAAGHAHVELNFVP